MKNKEGEIYLMKDKVKYLDKCLKMFDMSFKDVELGEDIFCENFFDVLLVKLFEIYGCGV